MAFHALNPHIVDAQKLHRGGEHLRELGGYGDEQRPYERAQAHFLRQYDRACSLFAGVKGLKEQFPDGLPIAYHLSPILKPAKSPLIKGAKFGGIPDMKD